MRLKLFHLPLPKFEFLGSASFSLKGRPFRDFFLFPDSDLSTQSVFFSELDFFIKFACDGNGETEVKRDGCF
jgi:hypothetical protein